MSDGQGWDWDRVCLQKDSSREAFGALSSWWWWLHKSRHVLKFIELYTIKAILLYVHVKNVTTKIKLLDECQEEVRSICC